MAINFHDKNNQQSYATRFADPGWLETIKSMINTEKIHHAADIGCGGGIYTKALADLGIPEVIGVDFSKAMIDCAKLNCQEYTQLNFQAGNAYDTGLPKKAVDLVLERALIHHLTDLSSCFSEAYSVLKYDGTFLIQDRTPDDCLLKGTSNHIRGYFFTKFPYLAELEGNRRHSSKSVVKGLEEAGFTVIEEVNLWETRKMYRSKEALLADIRSRNGRSILHELSDNEIEELVSFIREELDNIEEIIEKDRWTIWKAIKIRGAK